MDQNSRNILNMARDPMCVPQVANDPFRLTGETYAQSYREYLIFLFNHDVDLNDPMVIY